MKNSLQISRHPSKRWVHGWRMTAFLLVVLSSLTARAQLSGTYTICASGCDYSTISDAVTDLQNNGVGGAVTMQIKPGDYNETIDLNGISGISASNTLTFKGTGTNPTDVYIHDGSNSYVWQMYGMSYVTLENLHIEQETASDYYFGLYISSSDYITVRNCRLTADTKGGGYYDNCAVLLEYSNYDLFEKNWIRGGYDGINDGEYSGSGGYQNIYKNNWFTKQACNSLDIYYASSCQYLNNYFDSSSANYCSAVYSYNEYDSKYINNTFIFGGSGFQYGNWWFPGGGTNEITNNTMLGLTQSLYPCYLAPNTSSGTLKFYHNTIHQANSGGYNCVYLSNPGMKIYFQNNILTRSSSGLTLQQNASKGGSANEVFEGNDYYNTGGNLVQYLGTQYATLSAYQAAAAANGTGYSDMNMAVTYKSANDLHLDKTTVAPFGKSVGVLKDIDGDARCSTFPTSGADESTYSGNANYKKPSSTKFTGPSKAYIGSPTTFFNSAPAGALSGYMWYVNGVKVSDSNHLTTTALTYPSSKVKLVAYNCGGKDSFETTVTVDSPSTAPTTDFISDANVIRQGETVQFTDLSTGYPSQWSWDITPTAGILNGSPAATFKYVYGSKTTATNKVRFDIPGKYKVCMTASNVRGSGTKECKVDYIEVVPAVTMTTSLQTLNSTSGYIYDNGGPNGAPLYVNYTQTLPKVLIDACADSVYLVFKYFDMYCPYQYLRIYEGKDRQTGKELTCTGNKYSGAYGPGATGSATQTGCSQNCTPIHNTVNGVVYDTFKASKYMYLEMEANTTSSNPGFEAYYWTKPRTQPKPKASFTSVDSICTNGQVIFTNTTTGSDVTYLWDLDDDMSFFEATSKNTNWPYFAPGTYKVTMIAMNCGGTDTFTKNITVFNPKKPVTSFTADNVTPTTNDVVFFSKDMPMCVDDYTWTITPSSGLGKATYVNGTKSTSANPQVMFSDPGCYDVQLVTKNVSGTDQLKLTCFINVRSPYCIPTTQNKAADLGISEVKLNTLDNKSSQGTTSYSNFTTDPTKSTTIEIGVTYDLTVLRNTNKNKITRTAWIDWNIDGDFDDAGEKLGEQTNSSALDWTTPVKVPATAKTGATVMRIAVNQGSQSNTACGPNVFGEFEDYRVYVRPDATKPVITLVGADTVKIEQCTVYADAGATASDNLSGNITKDIKVTNTPAFDNMTPGTYIFRYNVKDAAGNQADEVRRIVVIGVDETAPNLIVPKPDTIYTEVFQAFTAPDATLAEDCVDGDLLSDVKTTGSVNKDVIGTYTVTYTVTDGSGNTATVTRTIIVQDKTLPVVALVGNNTITQEVGTPYVDGGVTVSDNYYNEAELRAVLSVQNNVDVNKLGTYTVVYTLTDPSGNGPVTVTRTVIVVDTQAPDVALINDATIEMDVNTTFADPGVTIKDNYDQNLNTWDTAGTFYSTFQDGFANQLGTYTVIYNVTDASGNATSVTRTVVVVDRIAPVGMLKGELAITVCRWSTYTDEGIDLTDNYDKPSDITVTPEGSFATSGTQQEGLYSLRFKLEDKSHNVSYTDWRKILVLSPNEGGCLTGMNNQSSMDKYINVYPNPNTGKFTVKVQLPQSESVKITVTNALGQQVAVVAEGMMSSNTISVDLTNQSSGVYFLNIQTPTQNVVKQVVISK